MSHGTLPPAVGASLRELEPYIAAVDGASARARNILLLVVASSLLTFSVVRLPFWLGVRLQAAQDAVRFDACRAGAPMPEGPDLRDRFRRARAFCEALGESWDGLSASELDERRAAMRARVEAYHALRYRHAFVFQVPVFGSAFDHNDIGLIAGPSLTCLMVFLAYAMLRERLNHAEALAQAGNLGLLSECRSRLALSQVLTLPAGTSGLPRWLPKAGFFAPALAMTYVSLDHYSTFPLGEALDPAQNCTVLVITLAGTLAVLCIGYRCLRISKSFDEQWEERESDSGPDARVPGS